MNGCKKYYLLNDDCRKGYLVYIDDDSCLRFGYYTLTGRFETLEWLLSINKNDLFEAKSFDEAKEHFCNELLKAEVGN